MRCKMKEKYSYLNLYEQRKILELTKRQIRRYFQIDI